MNNDPKSRADRNSWLSYTGALNIALIAATGLVFYVCYRLAYPFLPAVTWALALAVLAYPLHDRLVRRIRHASLAAGLAVVIVMVGIVGPGALVGHRLLTEAGRGVQALRKQTESEQWRTFISEHPQLSRALALIEPYVDIRSAAESAANLAASWLSALVGGSIWVAVQLLIMLLTLFYFFRDRHAALKAVKSLMPLTSSEADKLFSRIGDIISGTIYGIFAVALVQGILGGLMFWWLGLPGPLLWGIIMTVLSLVPVLGAPVVWIPAAGFLALTGSWGKAVILAGWGVIVIGIIDNLLYPILVGDKVRMHTLVIFFSVVGGLFVLGSAGLLLGPIAVAAATSLMDVWRQRAANED